MSADIVKTLQLGDVIGTLQFKDWLNMLVLQAELGNAVYRPIKVAL